jgi:hypothetical protein
VEITIKAVGTKDLLLHNVDLANPLNTHARRMTELRATPSKRRTEKWFEDMAREQFLGAFYVVPDIDGPALPTENLRRSIVGAAKASRQGTHVLRALEVTAAFVPIIYDGPRSLDKLWDQSWYLTRMIRGTGGASPTTFPKFPAGGWAVKVPFELDESVLNLRDLEEIAQRAGRIEGLGASRKQGYGRYDALIETSSQRLAVAA